MQLEQSLFYNLIILSLFILNISFFNFFLKDNIIASRSTRVGASQTQMILRRSLGRAIIRQPALPGCAKAELMHGKTKFHL